MFWIPIQGTNGWPEHPQHEWWFAGDALNGPSPFVRFMAARGWHVWNPADPFVWSTDVNGLGPLSRLLPGTGKRDWRAGGKSLRWYLDDLPPEFLAQLVLMPHSQGLQVVSEALADPRAPQIAGVISVGSPIRADMRAIAQAARPRMGYWLHLHARLDLWQRLGQVFDGDVNLRGRWPRDYPRPDRIVELAGAGASVHSEILRNAQLFPQWVEQGWLQTLEATVAAA